jgi:hypothetical protein
MIHLSKSFLYINEIKQPVYYFVLPKSPGDLLFVNVPEIVHEIFDQWMTEGKQDVFLDAINKKYTFTDAQVDNYVIGRNRYGRLSRSLNISFLAMSFGFNIRNKDA